ncbi:MAG: tRNA lysidine(34) synthetase TilS [Candidatus Kapabacteria bacterium]|nr:tRNA lysidine(34) synthetase TilS [Candidatus Kapabacteria bacterium]
MTPDVRSGVQLMLTQHGIRQRCVLLAVSGGVDSMTLLDVVAALAHELHLTVHVAHVDHAIRTESPADAAFVEAEALRRGLTFHTTRINIPTLAETSGLGIEATARKHRYDYLTGLAESIGASIVMTGHTADDVIETVLMNIARAGSLETLAGIPRSRPLSESVSVVRPLLEMRRTEIVAYAEGVGVQWVDDPSNAEGIYLRNRVRAEVLPVLESVFGQGIGRNILRLARAMGEMSTVADELAATRLAEHIRFDSHAAMVDVAMLAAEPRVVVDSFLHKSLRLGTADRDRIHDLAGAEVGSQASLSAGRSALRERSEIVITHVDAAKPPEGITVLSKLSATYHREDQTLEVEAIDVRSAILDSTPSGNSAAIIDLDAISGSLYWRPWQPGERMRLLGMDGTKLVSDILTDAKIPHRMRNRIQVVADEQGILWICGVRRSNRGLCTEGTRRAILCTLR